MDSDTEKTPLHPAPLYAPPINVDPPCDTNEGGKGIDCDSNRYLRPIESVATQSVDVKEFYTFHIRGGRTFTIRSQKLNIILTVLTVITNLIMLVTLPLLNNTVGKYADYYPVILLTAIWFQPFFFGLVFLNKYINPLAEIRSSVSHKLMALLGLLNALNGIFVVYAADVRRTSGSLQALLATSSIPFTVIFRYLLLRKGVGRGRLICTGIVLVGLFISLEPEIFNLEGETRAADAVKGVMKVVWPIIFLLGFLPLGILNVLIERELKKDQTESLVFLAWVQLYNFLFIALLFWTDFIPEFGASSNLKEFGEHMLYTLKCFYFADSTCMTAVAAYFVFILAYCCANLLIFLLVKYAEGAIWLVLVQALVTPLGSLFYTVFSVSPVGTQTHGKFHWAPNFDLSVAFRFAGILILVPTVAFYNYFGERERKAAQQRILSDKN